MEELKQKLESLETRATRLEREIDNEADRDVKLARINALTALNNRITELQKEKNILFTAIFLSNLPLLIQAFSSF